MNESSQFGEATRQYQYPLLREDVDLDFYNIRKIHHLFPRASKELDTLIINLAHHPTLAVRSRCQSLNSYYLNQSIKLLVSKGFIQKIKSHYHNLDGKGLCSVYKITELFTTSIKFSKPNRIRLVASSLALSHSLYYWQKSYLESGIQLKNWLKIVGRVRLSLSNGNQVYERVIPTKHKARIFTKGNYSYQFLSENDRQFLLIDGEPTAELDYKSLHPNLCLNMAGKPCDTLLYEKLLKELGLRKCKKRRRAIKLLVLISLNIGSRGSFTRYCLGEVAENKRDKRVIEATKVLGVHPSLIYKAIDKVYPELKPYICNGKHALMLQQKDSEIMEDVLETLALGGAVALPVYDSIIVPAKHRDFAKQTMLNCYKKHTGFEIKVK